MYRRNEVALGIAKTTQSRTENGISPCFVDVTASDDPSIADSCREPKCAHDRWTVFHVKHVGPGDDPPGPTML